MRGRGHFDLVDAQGHPLKGRVADVLRSVHRRCDATFPISVMTSTSSTSWKKATSGSRPGRSSRAGATSASVRPAHASHIAIRRCDYCAPLHARSLSNSAGQSVLGLRSPWHTPEQIELRVLSRGRCLPHAGRERRVQPTTPGLFVPGDRERAQVPSGCGNRNASPRDTQDAKDVSVS